MVWGKRTAVCQELVQPRSAAPWIHLRIRKRVETNVGGVSDSVAEEYRGVDEGVVEGASVLLVLNKRRPRTSEHLDSHAAPGAKQSVGPDVRQPIGEAHHSFILGGVGKDPLGIRRRQAVEHHNLCTKEPVTLGMSLPDSTTLGLNRGPDIILHVLKKCLQIRFVIRRIDFSEILEA